eukprot:279894_1
MASQSNQDTHQQIIDAFLAITNGKQFTTNHNVSTGCSNDCEEFWHQCTNMAPSDMDESNINNDGQWTILIDTYHDITLNKTMPYAAIQCCQNNKFVHKSKYPYHHYANFQENPDRSDLVNQLFQPQHNRQMFSVFKTDPLFNQYDINVFNQLYKFKRNQWCAYNL